MAQRRGSVLWVMPLLVLTLFLVGCPKRPAAPVGGNRFALARVVVPLGPKDPAKRLGAVVRSLESVAAEPGHVAMYAQNGNAVAAE